MSCNVTETRKEREIENGANTAMASHCDLSHVRWNFASPGTPLLLMIKAKAAETLRIWDYVKAEENLGAFILDGYCTVLVDLVQVWPVEFREKHLKHVHAVAAAL